MGASGGRGSGQEVVSVFDDRVRREGRWELENKRLSGFRRSLMPAEDGAKLRLEFDGRAVSLLRASPWRAWPTKAGQAYGLFGERSILRPAADLEGVRLVVKVDDGPTRQVDVAAAPVEIPLAENLAAGSHRLELTYPTSCRLPVLGFRVVCGGFGAISGRVSADASDYLNDVSVGMYRGGQLLEERLDRNPLSGQVLVWALEPGVYDLHLHAIGWQDAWVRQVRVEAGKTSDFGEVHLAADPLAGPRGAIEQPARGCPAVVRPGEGFSVAYRVPGSAERFTAELVGSMNACTAAVKPASFDAGAGLWKLDVHVPEGAPEGLYHLRVTCSAGSDQAVQAVCVRRQHGPKFRIVKFGHMDTWTQRNAEYLRLLVELSNLIDPDLVLVGNEVNWQYVAGALSGLQAPYLVTSGNHGLPGFERYFGPPVGWLRLGDVFVANFGLDWTQDTKGLRAALEQAGDARYRILQGVEADLPAELGRELGVNLYAFGHGFTNQWLEAPDAAKSPPWLHLGKEFHLVTVDLETGEATVAAVAANIASTAAKYPIPREQPWLPVVFEPANDGRHSTVRATARNPLLVPLSDACLRFVMPAATYRPSVGRIARTIPSADGQHVQVEVRVDIPARGQAQVVLSSVQGHAGENATTGPSVSPLSR